MPEGDTIWRTAATLRQAILGQRVTAFHSSVRQVSDAAQRLNVVGSVVDRIETRGKHLLMQFSCGATLRTHMQMTGSWHVYRPGSPWKKPSGLSVAVIETPRAVAVCFSAPIVELCDTASLSSLRGVRHLGPDILDPSFDLEQVLARLRVRGDKEIALALLDQSALAGIGNVYKNEVLFLCGVSPFARTSSIDSATLRRIVETAVRLMRRNLTTAIRTTTSSGLPRPLWVYGAHGRPCQRCGSTIQRQTQGIQARMTYWCPTCQPVSPGTEGVSPLPVEQHEKAAAGNLTS